MLIILKLIFRLDLNMELPQGQMGSVGTSVASIEQVDVGIYFDFMHLVYLNK